MKKLMTGSTSVEKALSIIDCFDDQSNRLTLDEISERIQMPRTTAYRMLVSLERFGYVRKQTIQGKTKYALGYTFLEKGQLVYRQLDIRELAQEELVRLRDQTGLTVQLAIQEEHEAIYIEQIQSINSIQIYPRIGRKAPLYAAACPRVFLAYMEQKKQDELLKSFDYTAFTSTTMTDPEQIRKVLAKIREVGYSISKGELYQGTFAIAVPVFDPSHRTVLAAISVVGLEHEVIRKKESLICQVKEAADRIKDKMKRNR